MRCKGEYGLVIDITSQGAALYMYLQAVLTNLMATEQMVAQFVEDKLCLGDVQQYRQQQR